MTIKDNIQSGISQGTLLTSIRHRAKNFYALLSEIIANTILQIRIYKKLYPGVMHALIFWGVSIQVIGTAINLMQMALFIPLIELPFPRNGLYIAYELIMDLAGASILLGVIMASLRRIVMRPKTLETRWDDSYALIMLGLIPIVGFSLEGLRLLSTEAAWSQWSPVGNQIRNFLVLLGLSRETAADIHTYFLWTHVSLVLIFVASIPFTKLRHLILTPLNILLRPKRKIGTLDKIEDIEETELLGVGKINEFSSQQLLSFDACVSCGRCEEVCPVSSTGIAYSPRQFIQLLRSSMVSNLISQNGSNGHELLGDAVPEEYPWACTTCGACLTRCPSFINPVDEIIDLRRYQTLTTGKLPKSVADVLRNMERQGNPWGMPPEERVTWLTDLEVREIVPGEETDILIFLGCAFAFDERNRKVARSLIKILKQHEVNFALLGLDEMCCGETARRLGHEYLFQTFAEQNIEILNQITFNRIITQCPHCFNTLKNEYPQMGGNYSVQHYTEYINEVLSEKLESDSIFAEGLDVSDNSRVVYQDSCYLGRYNQIYQEPRNLLNLANVSIVEMERFGENSFCCGGGGGQMWMETDPNTRINHKRLTDAINAQADVVATACPYCLLMFDDAIRSKGVSHDIQVMDIAEIVDLKLNHREATST